VTPPITGVRGVVPVSACLNLGILTQDSWSALVTLPPLADLPGWDGGDETWKSESNCLFVYELEFRPMGK
jgi:hypothetical protein